MLFERKNNTEQERNYHTPLRFCVELNGNERCRVSDWLSAWGFPLERHEGRQRVYRCRNERFVKQLRRQEPVVSLCGEPSLYTGKSELGPNPQHISNLRLWTSLVARRSRRFHNRFMDAWKMGLGFKDSMLLLQVMIFTHGTDFSGLFRGLFGFEYAAGRLRSVHTRTLQPNLGYSLKLLNYPLFFNEIILRICLLSSSFLIRQMYI